MHLRWRGDRCGFVFWAFGWRQKRRDILCVSVRCKRQPRSQRRRGEGGVTARGYLRPDGDTWYIACYINYEKLVRRTYDEMHYAYDVHTTIGRWFAGLVCPIVDSCHKGVGIRNLLTQSTRIQYSYYRSTYVDRCTKVRIISIIYTTAVSHGSIASTQGI